MNEKYNEEIILVFGNNGMNLGFILVDFWIKFF